MHHAARIVSFATPKGVLLNGLWFGAARARRVIVFVHGLGGSVFARLEINSRLARGSTAVLSFNNRGHDKVALLRRIRPRGKSRGDAAQMSYAGDAHEVFTECSDDIRGAVDFARSCGAREVVLMGHSTGCQKIAYYLAQKKNRRGIKSGVLLAPVSDYAWAAHSVPPAKLRRAQRHAQQLVAAGKPQALLPLHIWPGMHDAQRFLSLYSPDGTEEIFSYAQPAKRPTTLHRIATPLYVVFAEKDEYCNEPLPEIIAWFEKHLRAKRWEIKTIRSTGHGFNGKERQTVAAVRGWMDRR